MKLRNLIFGFMGVLLLGTVGYHVIEGWDYFDSFYMTSITITTVGFGELHPLSTAVGRPEQIQRMITRAQHIF